MPHYLRLSLLNKPLNLPHNLCITKLDHITQPFIVVSKLPTTLYNLPVAVLIDIIDLGFKMAQLWGYFGDDLTEGLDGVTGV